MQTRITKYNGYEIHCARPNSHTAIIYKDGVLVKCIAGDILANGNTNRTAKAKIFIDGIITPTSPEKLLDRIIFDLFKIHTVTNDLQVTGELKLEFFNGPVRVEDFNAAMAALPISSEWFVRVHNVVTVGGNVRVKIVLS